jgi:hypothetical protein
MPDNRARGQFLESGLSPVFWSAVVYALLVALALVLGGLLRSPKIVIAISAIIMVASFYFWVTSYRVRRALVDVPTSRIRSAAQGYVELHGTIESLQGRTLEGPLTKAPCVMYSYAVTEGTGDKKEAVDTGSERIPFQLRDETGICLIDPRDARFICDTLAAWNESRRSYQEWSMREGDSVYAIGLFKTDAVQGQVVGKEAMAQLRAWLRDPKAFFARFDSDRDGKVSRAELDAANEAARREMIERYMAQGGKHRLAAPRDGRPFIVSTMPHEGMARHFGIVTLVHFGVLLSAAAVLFAMFLHIAPV